MDYEDTIINLFKGINYPKYKNEEKLFVDTLYNCPIWELDTHFPNEEAKKEKIIELKDKYDQERDQTVKNWVTLITFFLLIDKKKAPEKRYNEIYDIINIDGGNIKEIFKIMIEERKEIYNYIFINSFVDFYVGLYNISISTFILSEKNTEFDVLLKTNNHNFLVNDEVIGISKYFNKDETFGEILFTRIKIINNEITHKDFENFILQKKDKKDNEFSIAKLTSSGIIIRLYYLTENGKYENKGTFSIPKDQNINNAEIVPQSFFLLNRDDCKRAKIEQEIDKISKSLRKIHKDEIKEARNTMQNILNIPPQKHTDLRILEGLNLNYLYEACFGNNIILIGDNKEARWHISKDDITNTEKK